MGSLYEKIKHNNTDQTQVSTEGFARPAVITHDGLTPDEAQRYINYQRTENGKSYLAWEARAAKYLGRVDQLEAQFQKAFKADLVDAESRVSKFRGALNTQGKPAVLKYNVLIWILILAAPFLIAAASMGLGLAGGGEPGTATALESTQVLMLGLAVAMVLAIAYPLSRKHLMMRKAAKSLRKTGLSAAGTADTISYHRSLYGFFYQGGNPKAMSDQDFVHAVYRSAIDFDHAHSMHFYDMEENLPCKIRDFIKNAPKTLPSDFPSLDAPKAVNYRKFPNDAETQIFLENLAENKEMQRELSSF